MSLYFNLVIKSIILNLLIHYSKCHSNLVFKRFAWYILKVCRRGSTKGNVLDYVFCFLIYIYWSIIASQYFLSFCCTTKRISHMHTHVAMSPPSWASLPSSLSHPSRSLQSTKPISLCYAAASHQPTILHSVVYICWGYSHFAPTLLSHPTSSNPFCLSTSLFLPCNWIHQYLFFFFFFLDSIHMH